MSYEFVALHLTLHKKETVSGQKENLAYSVKSELSEGTRLFSWSLRDIQN